MIDLVLIIIFFVAFMLFDMLTLQEEVRMVIKFILASGLLFYVSYVVEDGNVSKLFLVLAVLCIILIPLIIVLKYMEKL